MKVVTAQTMQELDKQAISNCGIPGLQLMETAGQSCVDEIIAAFGLGGFAVILAGKGNNGGDGYVIARLLRENGWAVRVIILADREQIAGDAATNLARLPDEVLFFCADEDELAAAHSDEMRTADILVDALLGTGLSSTVSGIYRGAIELMNASGRPVMAVDIPSGIHGTTGKVLGSAVKAAVTVTFAFAKVGHVLYPGADNVGRLVVADIGIPSQLMANASGYEFLNADLAISLLHRRDRHAHKGQFGHCLIVAGSTGKTGAAALAANSAVRAGSGLVTVAVAESINSILEVKTTEAMTVPLADSGSGYLAGAAFPAIEMLLEGKAAVAVGPGVCGHPDTASLVQMLVERIEQPLVIDADGLNALAIDVSVLHRKKSRQIVLTPHPGEMSRLLGIAVADIEANRIAAAQDFARNYGVYLILKGARTIVAAPDGAVAINGSGNPGMASGGMGDVLTGIVVSLLGQGYSAWEACCLGVFLHGFAADMAAEEKGEVGIIASDVIERLPYAGKALSEGSSPQRPQGTAEKNWGLNSWYIR